MEIAGDRPPRYDKKTVLETTRGTGPRAAMKKRHPLTVGRGPVPRQRPHASPCRAGSSEALAYLPSDPELFVIRRSQTTEVETHLVTMELAGDRPPRYDEKTPLTVGRGPVPRQRPRNSTIAGDRPPRYDKKNGA